MILCLVYGMSGRTFCCPGFGFMHILIMAIITECLLRSEWGGGGFLNDTYVKAMVFSLAYVMLSGAFCEWCWIVKGRSQVFSTHGFPPEGARLCLNLQARG